MEDSIINVFAMVGAFAIIGGIGMFLLIFIESMKDRIRIAKRRKKREYDITHRFEKKPNAKCHCIDCKYCQGYMSGNDWEPRAISCELWGRSMVTYDSSFCYRAEPKI